MSGLCNKQTAGLSSSTQPSAGTVSWNNLRCCLVLLTDNNYYCMRFTVTSSWQWFTPHKVANFVIIFTKVTCAKRLNINRHGLKSIFNEQIVNNNNSLWYSSRLPPLVQRLVWGRKSNMEQGKHSYILGSVTSKYSSWNWIENMLNFSKKPLKKKKFPLAYPISSTNPWTYPERAQY